MRRRKPRDPADEITCKLCHKRFRAITYRHLRNIHDFVGEHPILDYKKKFDLAFAMCRDSRQKISVAKEDFWDERGQHWTPKDVLAEIRRLHRAGKSLRSKHLPARLPLAGRRLFGSWQKAIEAAGFDYEQVTGFRRWNRERVIAEIKRLAATGVPLNGTHIQQHHSALYTAAIKLFPKSWAKALLVAGFDPAEHRLSRGVWNRHNAEDWVRNQDAKKKSLLARDVPPDLLGFVYTRLETGWAEFIESVTGRPYPGIKKQRDWSREMVIAEIRRMKSEGKPLNYRAVADAGQAIIHQARKYFGSWDAALAAAGVRDLRDSPRLTIR